MNDVFKNNIIQNGKSYVQMDYNDMLLGDIVGTNYVFKYFKQQFPDTKFYIVETEKMMVPIDILKSIKLTLNGIDGIMTKEEFESLNIKCDNLFGFPIWLFSSIIHQVSNVENTIDIRKDSYLNEAIKFKNKYKNKIVSISPIKDAGDRNPMRNWTTDVIKGHIDMFLNKGYVVMGLRYKNNENLKAIYDEYKNKKNFIEISREIIDSIRAISTSTWFVGGDTGLTHFVSNMGKYGPENIIALYFKYSKMSYWEMDGWQINNYRVNYFNDKYSHLLHKYANSSAPKITNDQILYLIMETHDMKSIISIYKDAKSKGYKMPDANVTKKELTDIKNFINS